MVRLLIAALVVGTPAVALAQTAPAAPVGLTLKMEAFIAREVTDKAGVKKKVLMSTDLAQPGDPIVYMVNYANNGTKPAAAAAIDDPVPGGVRYTSAAEPWAVVSVDGGKTFGPLATLKVKKPDGTLRSANPDEVTNVRWKFAQPLAPGAKGRVMFYAVIR